MTIRMLDRSSPLSSASVDYIEGLYRSFHDNPERLDESWRCVFVVLDLIGEASRVDVLHELASRNEERNAQLVEVLRARGHLYARLDPLGRPTDSGDEEAALLAHLPPEPPSPDDLRSRHTGSLAVETAHIDDAALRNWLVEAFEAGRRPTCPDDARDFLWDLVRADVFESFLARKFPTKKRFGAEGAEAVVPLLRRVLRGAAARGVTHVVLGTMHRGRLSLSANVLGRPLAQLLAELRGAHPFPTASDRPGDVPYHLGHRGCVDTGAGVLEVTLLANPSHLEAVDPVVLGRARALQEAQGSSGAARVLPVILHTDAAVAGQGVVAEVLQLASVPGFSTGGTVHIVVNNQIGFTTNPAEARSSTHCTGIWKAIDSCILHVNGDDGAAVSRAAALAVHWRQTHARDAVIDLVCYRRNGHNEIDEPIFTQPVLYRRIAAQVPIAQAAARRLIDEGVVSERAVRDLADACQAELDGAYAASETFRPNTGSTLDQGLRRVAPGSPTGVEPARLLAVSEALTRAPDGVALHPKVERLLRQRDVREGKVAWALAEALAFGTLLQDGVGVRLTGQDVVRGAFSHRHYGLVDQLTGAHHLALAGFGGADACFAVHNSPLSEYAVLGFEYGYSLERPNDLTIWEAQFGDFANGAQVILDQFVAAGEEKWCAPSGLVVLLPHGLEGQGPEHSSARLERFLQLAARDNMRVANPSTPANHFHVLRRQALVADRKPLILMGPKRLLRLPAATSPLDAFGPDRAFEPVLVDTAGPAIGRVLLCSGKIAYDLLAERDRRGAVDVAIVRLEELYPFPEAELRQVFAACPDASCLFVQEEPCNMGAWSYLDRKLERVRRETGARWPQVTYVGRRESGSPAGCFHGDHDDEQARIVAAAFEGGP